MDALYESMAIGDTEQKTADDNFNYACREIIWEEMKPSITLKTIQHQQEKNLKRKRIENLNQLKRQNVIWQAEFAKNYPGTGELPPPQETPVKPRRSTRSCHNKKQLFQESGGF